MDQLEICYMSAGDLSRLIREKEVSPVEVIDAHLARIQTTEPALNSFITLLPEQARAAARQAEREIQAGRYRGPLHGIPVALKDLFNTGGVRTTSGSKIFDTFVPTEDCTVAARFREAGAILLGKLNMHQFAFGPTGENPDYGHMHNPWNPEMVTGGVKRRLRVCRCGRPMHHHHGQRHRRLHSHSVGPLRHRGPQADLRGGEPPRAPAPFLVLGPSRAHGEDGRGRGPGHERHRRPRP